MPVNTLNPTAPYSIAASNETGEQTRQRNQNKSSKEKASTNIRLNKTTQEDKKFSESLEHPTADKEALELTSQIVDSQTVIELLAHRPKYKISPKKLFSASKTESEISQNTDIKKLNKAF